MFSRMPAFAFCLSDEVAKIITSHELEILTLASLSSIKVLLSGKDDPPAGCAFENVNEIIKVYLKVEGNFDAESQREKITNKMDELQKQYDKLEKTINAPGYKEKAESHLLNISIEKLSTLMRELDFFKKERARLDAKDRS
uniref:valine--tRNA ligase n=1 Tax=Rhizophora mucronata TaxID=61149 RepID=A0A2P2KHK9_RHIMU